MSSNSAIPQAKLSQWEALTLESLRSKGWSNEQIISSIAGGELPQDDSKFQFDYSILTQLASEQPQQFASAIQDGYSIKYNTIRGIHSWISVALQKEGELVLEPDKEAIYVQLTAAEAEQLASVLSYGWEINTAAAAGNTQQADKPESDEHAAVTYEIKHIAARLA